MKGSLEIGGCLLRRKTVHFCKVFLKIQSLCYEPPSIGIRWRSWPLVGIPLFVASIWRVDLIPTMEEYLRLLGLIVHLEKHYYPSIHPCISK